MRDLGRIISSYPLAITRVSLGGAVSICTLQIYIKDVDTSRSVFMYSAFVGVFLHKFFCENV